MALSMVYRVLKAALRGVVLAVMVVAVAAYRVVTFQDEMCVDDLEEITAHSMRNHEQGIEGPMNASVVFDERQNQWCYIVE